MKTIDIPAKFFGGPMKAVRLIVIHSTENDILPGMATNVAGWFRNPWDGKKWVKVSAHYIVDADQIIQCVSEARQAWHCPPVNDKSIGIEMVGRARYTATQWQSEAGHRMIELVRCLVSDIVERHKLPRVVVDVAGLHAGNSGITRHMDVTSAFHKSTHTDPGNGFDLDWLMK